VGVNGIVDRTEIGRAPAFPGGAYDRLSAYVRHSS